MRQEIAQKFDEVLAEVNFSSTLVNYNQTEAVRIDHEEVSAELALQHIQEFLEQQIEDDTDWFFENEIENVSEFNTEVKKKYTLLY